MNFVDIHAHVIPRIDDGASSDEVLFEMLRLAYRTGTRGLVATPHMFLPPFNNNDPAMVETAFAGMIGTLQRQRSEPGWSFLGDMSLYLGAENYLSPEFLQALESDHVLSMNRSFYLLVEFPAFLSFEMLTSAMERILAAGRVPVLAHVERYPPFCENPGTLEHLLQMGCVAQLNGTSILTRGRAQRKLALSLLNRGLVQVIASDAHEDRVRTPVLDRVFAALRKTFPEHDVMAWMFDNPRRILANQGLN